MSVSIADDLAAALAMTEQALDGVVDAPEIRALLAERAVLIDRADHSRSDGAAWGDREAKLAAKIVAADKRLVEALWSPRKDAFAWLDSRAPDATEGLPLLRALAVRDRESS